ncbi:hypothetical protein MKK69_23570 [Methylobacterium sp. J-026]|uniref:hypothetical protein n=1 Tax=Methylobacterium sp. J-026 TaxID=2836624 RepID=UPI001FBBEB9A|nr:hypothetical protein [Methylobacterium sp. J-026]MCJ2136991.1 hypothetical protein [Methylobacterium sp. J-026]
MAAARVRESYRATAQAKTLARRFDPGDALPSGAARAEIYQGGESAARRAIEIVAPIVARAGSWAALHRDLATEEIVYASKGSGAILIIDGQVIKASTCRAASLAKLQARLGPFEPGPAAQGVRPAYLPEAQPSGSPRAAPGTDPELHVLARRRKHEADRVRERYDASYPALDAMPLLKSVLVGPRPSTAPSARTLARQTGRSPPKLAPLKRDNEPAARIPHTLATCHAALDASRYRLVAVRPAPVPHDPIDRSVRPVRIPDRLAHIPPSPMAKIAAALPGFLAAFDDRTIHLAPDDDRRHHVVLADLDARAVDRLQRRFSPSLILARGRRRFDAVLSATKLLLPFEMAAVARAAAAIRGFVGAARGRLGLTILDDPSPDGFRLFAHAIQTTGKDCSAFAAAIQRQARWFVRRFGVGASSRSGVAPDAAHPTQPVPPDAMLYREHRLNILAMWEGPWPDASRVDALVARRLRVSGHDQTEVAALIAAYAPSTAGRHRDWQAYGKRAAAHAFSDLDDGSWTFDRRPDAEPSDMLRRKRKLNAEKTEPSTPLLSTPPEIIGALRPTPVRRPVGRRSERGIGDD